MFKWLDRFVAWLITPQDPKRPVVVPMPVEASTTPPVVIKPPEVKIEPPKPLSHREKLYILAKHYIGSHLGLDTSIPNDVNCANTVTNLLILAGITGLPPKGIAGTAAFYEWLKVNKQFKVVAVPLAGDVIISPTGYGNGSVTGHTGIVGEDNILSNYSPTGKLDTKWTLAKWQAHYGKEGQLPVKFFRWV